MGWLNSNLINPASTGSWHWRAPAARQSAWPATAASRWGLLGAGRPHSGSLTPAGSTYRLGGGGGVLTVVDGADRQQWPGRLRRRLRRHADLDRQQLVQRRHDDRQRRPAGVQQRRQPGSQRQHQRRRVADPAGPGTLTLGGTNTYSGGHDGQRRRPGRQRPADGLHRQRQCGRPPQRDRLRRQPHPRRQRRHSRPGQ